VRHIPSQTSFVRKVDFQLQGLHAVPADPLVGIPCHDLDGRRGIKGDCCTVGDNLLDLGCGEHARCAGAFTTAGAVGERAACRQATGIFHGEACNTSAKRGVGKERCRCRTSSVEAESHCHSAWVDVVPPKQLERLVDLGQVCVCVGVGAEGFDGGIPYTIWSGI